MTETNEPPLVTPAELTGIRDELMGMEPILYRPDKGGSRFDLSRLFVKDFWEVGASGRRYSRDYCIDLLEQRIFDPVKEPWTIHDSFCQSLGADTFLIAYTMQQGRRITRRTTIWQRTPMGWKAAFHQATALDND